MANQGLNIDNLTPEQFDELLAQHEREIQLGNVPEGSRRPAAPPKRWFRPLMLFAATCLSTWYVGGPEYSMALMAILLFHEMGHFLQSIRYHVPASFPYFIPMPLPPIGTMGAVIIQRRGAGDRKALFDIAISGPLAGLLIALPMTYLGIQWSTVQLVPTNGAGFQFGEPLIFQWLINYVHGPIPQGYDLFMHPFAHAGWVGIFITALNLVPVSQLDGGHIMYALLRKKAHIVAIGFLLLVVGYMAWTGRYQWLLMVALVTFMGPKHPPTANDNVPLGWGRKILGWLTLAFLIIGITPDPIRYYDPGEQRPVRKPAAIELITPPQHGANPTQPG
ncbi:Peptidase family M50 [Symmachiella macrocystis]|uniref:Peptidase family M50 n=1 Tax=Symmachiella macrocystis TaxID=2527985 RepID=A0A5C6BRR6_9PLAN|nr:site-2 protease family protein [Symmachiella macrocystis]TWU14943.1 Peptidase family M50 [Symmachiella macrocystis]